MSGWLNAATGMTPATPFTACELANVTLCPQLEAPSPLYVAVYNALPVARTVPVRLPVGVNAVSSKRCAGCDVIAPLPNSPCPP